MKRHEPVWFGGGLALLVCVAVWLGLWLALWLPAPAVDWSAWPEYRGW